ncbi:MAG: M20 family metallopeptidase [Pyramidobacter sp.]|nr:M20 family metallopeptidase [Pyramidobacter sp.]
MTCIKESVAAAAEKARELRHHFHKHPELPWKEVETTARIAAELEARGIAVVKKGFGGVQSGLIAEIKGDLPGPVLAIRADIDALPVCEDPSLELKSEVEGVMHACGHDAHAAILIGAAEVIQAHKDELAGTIRLLFQPAEEAGYDSGAPAIIADGGLDGVDAIIGAHVWSDSPLGTIGWKHGPMMASADIYEMTIKGKGGHGGQPHKAVNPTLCAASMIPAIQSIVSQEIDTQEPVVVTVGSLHAGKAPNVIPEECFVSGNVRASTRETRNSMPERFERIAKGIAEAWRCTVDLKYTPVYPVTVNDNAMIDWVVDVVKAEGMGDRLYDMPFQMGSEDFSYYGEKVPAAYFYFGMGTNVPHHNPRFRVDDEVIPVGIRTLAALALDFGKRKQ